MSRHATDRVKQFHVMGVAVTPAPDANGDVIVSAGSPVFAVTITDPDNAPPYVISWEQQPVRDPSASFGTPAAQTTPFGPLAANKTYYVRVSATNRLQQTVHKSLRILVQ